MRRLLAATTDQRASGALEAAAAAALVPAAGVLDVLACAKFYLGQGCLP